MTKELTKRVITSLVLAIIVLNCLLKNNHSWLVLLIVVSLISWLEFFNLTKKIYKKIFPKLTLLILSFLVLLLFTYSAYKVRSELPDFVFSLRFLLRLLFLHFPVAHFSSYPRVNFCASWSWTEMI